MKLLSLQGLGLGINRVFRRFPLQFLIAIVSTVVWWYLIEKQEGNANLISSLGKFLIVSNFGFTLVLSSDLFCEVKAYSKVKKWVFRLFVILGCAGIYFLIYPFYNKADIFRVFLLAFAFHLLVSFAPFIGQTSLNGFWQYNKTLFLRFLTATFYAAVLFIGLSVALFAIDGLFNADIKPNAYMQLFTLVSAGFTTIFFLAGVPEDFSLLDKDNSYPKGLKIFTQYVLIPLMTIYLAILLVYEIKIMLVWSLPKGIVSSLILGYAVFGVLSLLLIHPIKNEPGNGWMRLFSKFFYLMMVPLIVLLILAVVKRTGNYGITEPRYILMALALWLTCISIYFLLSKKQSIKLIPISLCVLTLLSIYGPQSAFSVSKNSQTAILSQLMKSNDKNDLKRRSSVVRYLVDHHGLSALQPFTKVDLESLNAKIEAKIKKRNIYSYEIKNEKLDTAFALLKVKDLGINYDRTANYFNIVNSNRGLIDIKGYDAVFLIDGLSDSTKQLNGMKLIVTQKSEKKELRILTKVEVVLGAEATVAFDLNNLTKAVYQAYRSDQLLKNGQVYVYPSEKMQFTKETNNLMITLVVSTINGSYNKESDKFEWVDFRSYLLIKQKMYIDPSVIIK